MVWACHDKTTLDVYEIPVQIGIIGRGGRNAAFFLFHHNQFSAASPPTVLEDAGRVLVVVPRLPLTDTA